MSARAKAGTALGAAVVLALAAFALDAQERQAGSALGRTVYLKWCAGCHGDEGRGDGPAAAYLLPKPRDFTGSPYQVRTTATGELPTDADIRRIVDEGMPGTSMPGWRGTLSSAERAAAVQFIKSLSPAFGQASAPPAPLDFGRRGSGGREAVDSGRALYRRIECWKCHGDAGRGDGPSAPTLKDDFGNPMRAADLTQNWTFNGGPSAQDIFRRLRTGLDGTPMPAFSDLLEAGVVTEEQMWQLAHYVRSLSPPDPPPVREVVRAARLGGPVPAGPDDSAWTGVESHYFPVVGQVIVRPRWFAPMVNAVWVQAVHDGRTLAVRVRWHDPSHSPDTAWNVWQARLAGAMAPEDPLPAGATGLPDRLAVQFPASLPTDVERPYFLMGSADKPVYLWVWESAPHRAVEFTARGVEHVEPLSGLTDTLRATASWEHGEWRVQFERALTTADSTRQLPIATGRAIPVAFFAWDGSNGETGTRMAMSSWNAIYLAERAGAGTYLLPLFATMATAGLGVAVIWRARASPDG